MLSNPMFDTRQEFQPSMNFFAPINISTLVSGSLMPSKSESAMASSSSTMPESSASTSFLKVVVSPM